MDGWMDGWVDGWIDRWVVGWTDGQTDWQTDRQKDKLSPDVSYKHIHAGAGNSCILSRLPACVVCLCKQFEPK